jgi:hypothetical protein
MSDVGGYDPPIIGWRVVFADGTEYASSEGHNWDRDVPTSGIQFLVVYKERGYRDIECGLDEYSWPGARRKKLGTWMDDSAFYTLYDKVFRDTRRA